MTTPERPSLADTLARIDAVLDAYYDPTTNTREVDGVTRITSIVDHAAKPCLRCARQALRGSPYCAAHKRIPREMIEDLSPDALRPYSQYVEDGVSHPPDPWFNAQLVDTEPEPERGWLARVLKRLGVW